MVVRVVRVRLGVVEVRDFVLLFLVQVRSRHPGAFVGKYARRTGCVLYEDGTRCVIRCSSKCREMWCGDIGRVLPAKEGMTPVTSTQLILAVILYDLIGRPCNPVSLPFLDIIVLLPSS